MKAILSAAIVAVVALRSLGQEFTPITDAPNIFVEVQILALPTKDAVPLIRQLSEPGTRTQGFQNLDAKIASGECQILGWPMTTTRSNQSTVIEDNQEVVYATEYEPGGTRIIYQRDQSGSEKPPKEENVVLGSEFHPIPSGFQTKNCGFSLSISPVVDPDGKSISMDVSQEHTRLNAMKAVSITSEPKGEKVTVEQPECVVFRVRTSLTVESGSRVLLGVFPTSDPKDSMELFILRADVRGKYP